MSAVCTNLNLPIKCLPHFLQSEKSSDETPVGKAEIVVSGNNDVVQQPDGNGSQAARIFAVALNRRRLEAATRVVVGGIMAAALWRRAASTICRDRQALIDGAFMNKGMIHPVLKSDRLHEDLILAAVKRVWHTPLPLLSCSAGPSFHLSFKSRLGPVSDRSRAVFRLMPFTLSGLMACKHSDGSRSA